MTFGHMLLSFLQVAGELSPEAYARNFRFMFYGLLAAWLVLMAYVVLLAVRGRKLERELENLKRMMEGQEGK